ncbi:MAG: hypothetical protein OJF49_000932 [Ktedonobacterales bacterium]|nr:MAG: hypothetical protein OJF49_000932 [Ktedonobacterales bacterium]
MVERWSLRTEEQEGGIMSIPACVFHSQRFRSALPCILACALGGSRAVVRALG